MERVDILIWNGREENRTLGDSDGVKEQGLQLGSLLVQAGGHGESL